MVMSITQVPFLKASAMASGNSASASTTLPHFLYAAFISAPCNRHRLNFSAWLGLCAVRLGPGSVCNWGAYVLPTSTSLCLSTVSRRQSLHPGLCPVPPWNGIGVSRTFFMGIRGTHGGYYALADPLLLWVSYRRPHQPVDICPSRKAFLDYHFYSVFGNGRTLWRLYYLRVTAHRTACSTSLPGQVYGLSLSNPRGYSPRAAIKRVLPPCPRYLRPGNGLPVGWHPR